MIIVGNKGGVAVVQSPLTSGQVSDLGVLLYKKGGDGFLEYGQAHPRKTFLNFRASKILPCA